MARLLLASALAVLLLASSALATVYFEETFNDLSKWTPSEHKSDLGQFKLSAGKFFNDEVEDQGMQTSQDARFYASSAPFSTEMDNQDKPLVVQFSVKHEQTIDCGGGYLKVLPAGLNQKTFNGDSTYAIMFGPDICGYTKKIHAIFHYKGKNLLWKKEPRAESDELTHLYTLIVNPDNTYEVQVDGKRVEGGSLKDDWDFLPPKKIKDPKASKPSDWVDLKEIPDESDVKPAGYDDIPAQIADPKATKPDSWNDEDDGTWEAPMIDNPAYKGPWVQKKKPNPAYKGEWIHPEIDNPEFTDDPELYHQKSLAFVGIDLWQVKSGSIFDNIIVTDSTAEAKDFAKKTETTQAGEKKKKEAADAKKREEDEAKRKEEEAKKKEEEAKKPKEEEKKTDSGLKDLKASVGKEDL